MKLVTYEAGGKERVGAVRAGLVYDLGFDGDMLALIDAGPAALGPLRERLEAARPDSGVKESAVRLRAPLPNPRAIRDFFAFEDHAKAGAERRKEPMQKEWYEQPVYYKGNHREVYGPGDLLPWPAYTRKLDFEFEVAAVVGRRGRDIPVKLASEHLFGYMIFNDLSARDVQKNEMMCRMGPAKGKDFGNVFGPYLVTADEWDGRIPPLTVKVNGEVWSASNGLQPYWGFDVMLSHVSQSETVFPGDVLGSGTYFKGCGLDQDRWIKTGDILELEAGPLGTLRNIVGAPKGQVHLRYHRDGSYA